MEEQQDYDDFYDHPLVIKEIDLSKPLHPATKAILDMRFEGTPQEIALKYKDEGNYLFSKRKYLTALDNYEEGIKCPNEQLSKELLCQLYTNAGICYRKLLKHEKAIEYGKRVVDMDKDNVKALTLVGSSCLSMFRYDEAAMYLKSALELNYDDESLSKITTRANNLKVVNHNRILEKIVRDRQLKEEEKKVALAIKNRKIKIINLKDNNLQNLYNLTQPKETFLHHAYLKDGSLYWPLAFTFVEPGLTNFVVDFDENRKISEALQKILSSSHEWDTDNNYTMELVEIYCKHTQRLLNKHDKLVNIMEGISILDGIVEFIVLSVNSNFRL